MVKVRFFGVLRVDYKVKEMDCPVLKNISALLDHIAANSKIPLEELKSCAYYINKKVSKQSAKLADGDEVMILIPTAGG
jgi:molybdopterin converting factor small subunit